MERKKDGYTDLLVCPEEYSGKISRLLLPVVSTNTNPTLGTLWQLILIPSFQKLSHLLCESRIHEFCMQKLEINASPLMMGPHQVNKPSINLQPLTGDPAGSTRVHSYKMSPSISSLWTFNLRE